jgi:hypothetical protein
MFLRRIGPLSLALAALAGCHDVSQRPVKSEVVIAVYASPSIPAPNDLVLQAVPTLPAGALKDLLQSFVSAGGFPADQAPTLTVPLKLYTWDATQSVYVPSSTPPAIDPTTLKDGTIALLKVDESPAKAIGVEAAATQTPGSIALVPKADATGSRRLAPGRYVFAVRGGDSGARTTTGTPVGADLPIALTIPNKDLTILSNQPPNQPPGGIPAPEVQQLETIRALLWQPVAWGTLPAAVTGTVDLWIPCSSFPGGVPRPATCDATITPAYSAVDAAFPHAEVASIAAFQIAPPTGTVPLVDAASGQAPLPFDALRSGPKNSAGVHTIAPNPAFGAAAGGLATLDGFSTTAMVLAPMSLPVAASTVTVAGNVRLYDLGPGQGSGAGTLVSTVVTLPPSMVIPQGNAIVPGVTCPSTGGCAPAIGLQPAVPVSASVFLPPLAEGHSYAVVITNAVLDIAQHPLVRPTIMSLLTQSDDKPLANLATETSYLPGVLDDATATALETMRQQLKPVLAAVGADNVALAYTFRTQSFKTTSISLAAAPFSVEQGAGTAIFFPSAATEVTAVPPGIPTAGIAKFYDVTFTSIDGIDKTTGALRPTLAQDLGNPAVVPTLLTSLHALVAVPDAASVAGLPICAGATIRCPRLVVFGHGLNGSKEQLFAVASSLASRGFVAAAIDFPLHGSRNWCGANADCVVPGTAVQGTCQTFTGAAGQGDAIPPGQCIAGSVPVVPADSRYFISANFFRTRDAFRQDVLDVSALGLALGRPPAPLAPQPATNPFRDALASLGLAVDPTTIYYEGLSLGSIGGTTAIASNPRLSRAALSVGGGTVVDVFTHSPAFQADVEALFSGLLKDELGGQQFSFDMVDPTNAAFNLGVAQAYLQTVNVAKWILDPGEPVNFADNLRNHPLPNLLADATGATPQAAKNVFGQAAQNDTVIPNPFNFLLYTLANTDRTTLYTGAKATHGMLATVPLVQTDAGDFLLDLTLPPTVQPIP